MPRTASLVPAIAALLLTGCAAAPTRARLTASPVPSRDAARQIRADAFATVASRLYAEEAKGRAGRRNAARIARDPRLIRALESDRPAAIRAAALRQLFLPVKHVVRIRIVNHGRTLVDVGGAFVAGQESATMRSPRGRVLGRLDVSMQDILGLTKLERRFTGAQIVVHGNSRHVLATTPALTHLAIPKAGAVSTNGRRYVARSLRRTGFAGEPLRISVLVPA
jgi:hypothetical protein